MTEADEIRELLRATVDDWDDLTPPERAENLRVLARRAGAVETRHTLLTVEEAATRMRVSKMTVYRLCQQPDNPLGAVLAGRRSYRIPREALDAYLSRPIVVQ